MKHYAVQDGCHNCEHCAVFTPQDDPTYYYCRLTTKTKEPKEYDGPSFDKALRASAKYMRWRMTMTEVSSAGKCDLFERIAK